MTATLARAIMTLAGRCLGDRRRDWALAMRTEFEVAATDGKPLVFALGCLSGAVRGMPGEAEGRFTLTSHAVALGLLPFAALLLLATGSGFPFLPSGYAGISSWITGGGETLRLMTPWNRGFAPALALLIWGLVAGHVLMPWFILERDWTRVATLARINSAATVTLFLFTGALFLDVTFMVLPAIALAIELLAVWSLYRWQAQLFAGAPPGMTPGMTGA
jgi:hypothetical protein